MANRSVAASPRTKTLADVFAEARRLQVETRQLITQARGILDRCECGRRTEAAFTGYAAKAEAPGCRHGAPSADR